MCVKLHIGRVKLHIALCKITHRYKKPVGIRSRGIYKLYQYKVVGGGYNRVKIDMLASV